MIKGSIPLAGVEILNATAWGRRTMKTETKKQM
jgi:hypothetical protein